MTTETNIETSLMKLPIYRTDGTPSGEEVELDPRLFGLPRNDHVLYLAVKTEMTNKRQGTHSTKTRSEVQGGGKKPFKQKGRGAARAGSSRSPIWRGGGIIFGPKPHDYNMKMPRQAKRLARKVALSVKAQSNSITVIQDFNLEQPKTKEIAAILKTFEANGMSALFIIDGHKPIVVKSCQNIPRLEVRNGIESSTYDILRARKLLITRSALDNLVKGLVNEK
jgi:large subunit ribosomal protein L4